VSVTLGPAPHVLEDATGACGAARWSPGGTSLSAPGPAAPGELASVRSSCPSSATTIVSGRRHAGQTASTSSTACGYGADLHLHEAHTKNLGASACGTSGALCCCRGTHCAAALGEIAALSKSRMGAERGTLPAAATCGEACICIRLRRLALALAGVPGCGTGAGDPNAGWGARAREGLPPEEQAAGLADGRERPGEAAGETLELAPIPSPRWKNWAIGVDGAAPGEGADAEDPPWETFGHCEAPALPLLATLERYASGTGSLCLSARRRHAWHLSAKQEAH
jgi:hypothetical protein